MAEIMCFINNADQPMRLIRPFELNHDRHSGSCNHNYAKGTKSKKKLTTIAMAGMPATRRRTCRNHR